MLSIIIPAYNESSVIERCLSNLTSRPIAGGVEIIVCCNGCQDNTADLARRFGDPVTVVETVEASKIAALNLGDAAATSYPRIYLDADVEVDIDTIEAVADHLQTTRALAASPRIKVDLSHSSWMVKAFYRVWLLQPYHKHGLIGAGFYGVSEAGRARFGSFPSIIADDEYVRRHFEPQERVNPQGRTFTIHAPRTFSDLVRIKTRSRLGRIELSQKFPELKACYEEESEGKWFDIFKNPLLWPATGVYLFVVLLTKWRAHQQVGALNFYRWERDESSRSRADG